MPLLPAPINTAKELNVSSVLLATFQFRDGSLLRLSTHPFNVSEGGNQYASNDYFARIDRQDIQAVQARSEQGVDRISEVTLHLYNVDQWVFLNYEVTSGRGFKGAKLSLALVLMDIDPTTGDYVFSNDSPTPLKFLGICDGPQLDNAGKTFTVRAATAHNLARIDLPPTHIQPRCINLFPGNAAERLDGASNMASWFWQCGYCPDQNYDDPETGQTAQRRGNTTTPNATDAQGRVISDSSGNYILCNYTKADCVARGMYIKDSSNRKTGRYTGEQWYPPSRVGRSNSYILGRNISVFSNLVEEIYGRPYPLVYGTQWLKRPPVVNVIGDGNSTRYEIIMGSGDVGLDGVEEVICNGSIVPRLGSNRQIGGFTIHFDPLFRWNFSGDPLESHTGKRDGSPTNDAGYNDRNGVPQGDPHGSTAVIELVVYVDLAQSNGPPDVRIRRKGQKIKTPNTANPADQKTWPYVTSNISAWVLLDLLIWANYQYSELDLQTFIDAATVCGVSINYTDQNGTTQSHPRFMSEFALEDRRKANEVIQAVLRGFNAQLVPNSSTGLLQLFIRQTLADQQPSSAGAIAGSNYTTLVKSIHADGTAGNGYVAYLIDKTVLQHDGQGNLKMRGPYTLPVAQTPNRVTFGFQDADNHYADDTITVSDSEDVARAGGYQLGGQIVDAGFSVLGPSTFDQGVRVLNVAIAEGLRGNPQLDTRGTYFFDIETSIRPTHLHVGQICLFDIETLGLQPFVQLESPPSTPISGILVRVESISYTTDGRRMQLTLRWHEDLWYTDLFGQHAQRAIEDWRKLQRRRPPYPWHPYGEQPISGDAMFNHTEWNFALSQSYEAAADGSGIAKLNIGGRLPVNDLSVTTQPPLTKVQGSTANTGGTITGGQEYVIGLCAIDADNKVTALSQLIHINVPSGTNTNTLLTGTIVWASGTSGYLVFAGPDEQRLGFQSQGSGTPSSITLTSLDALDWGPPDTQFSNLMFRTKRVIHSGVFGASLTDVTTNTLTVVGAAWTTDWTGYACSILGQIDEDGNLPIADFLVTASDNENLTVTPDPLALGFKAGDVLVMRTKPDTYTATTIGDSNFINSIDYYDPPIQILDATNESPIQITTAGPNPYQTGDSVFISDVLGNDAANGRWTSITVIDNMHFTLDNSGGSGDYEGQGTVTLITNGMRVNEERDRIVRIISGLGRGQWRRIKSNTQTVITINGTFDPVPDNTSVFIVEAPDWLDETPTTPAINDDFARTVTYSVRVDNWLQQMLMTQVAAVSPEGIESLEAFNPYREFFLFGVPGPGVNYERAVFNLNDTTVRPDSNPHHIVVRPGIGVIIEIEVKKTITADLSVDLKKNGVLIASITAPSGSLPGQVYSSTTFPVSPLVMVEKETISSDITASDGQADPHGIATVVLKWRIDTLPGGGSSMMPLLP